MGGIIHIGDRDIDRFPSIWLERGDDDRILSTMFIEQFYCDGSAAGGPHRNIHRMPHGFQLNTKHNVKIRVLKALTSRLDRFDGKDGADMEVYVDGELKGSNRKRLAFCDPVAQGIAASPGEFTQPLYLGGNHDYLPAANAEIENITYTPYEGEIDYGVGYQ